MRRSGACARSDRAVAHPAGPPPTISTSQSRKTISILTNGVERCHHAGRRNTAVARTMRNGTEHRTHNGTTLQRGGAVGPDGYKPPDVIVNPLLAAYQALALKAYLHRRPEAK